MFPETRTNGFAPLTDWQLVARPPLVLENQLPVPGTFLVWEQPKVCHSSGSSRRYATRYVLNQAGSVTRSCPCLCSPKQTPRILR